MSTNPCCHDCDFTDGDEDPDIHDHGCCAPIPERRDCLRPVLPTPECNDTETTVVFDPETEIFRILARIFDENCEPILDENSIAITSYIN